MSRNRPWLIELVEGLPLTFSTGDKIVQCVKVAAERGIGLTRKQLMRRVNVLCKRMQVLGPELWCSQRIFS